MFIDCACDWLKTVIAVQCYVKARCVWECVGLTAVLGGQVFSCFCFLGADTGVNIQRMMSHPQQQARRLYKAKLSFHRDLSNIKTIWCPTVRSYGRVFWGYTWHGATNKLSRHGHRPQTTSDPNRPGWAEITELSTDLFAVFLYCVLRGLKVSIPEHILVL